MMAKIKITFDNHFNAGVEADISDADLPNLINAVLCIAETVATVTQKPVEEILAMACSLNRFEKERGATKEKTVIVMPHLDKDKPHD